MSKYLCSLYDLNVHGNIEFVVSSRRELTVIMEEAGSWQYLPDVEGALLLSDPRVLVYKGFDLETIHAANDPHPDYLVDILPRGTIRWTTA